MKKRILVTFAAAALLSQTALWTACEKKSETGGLTLEKGVLSVGIEIGYPPFEYWDTDGKTPIGFDVSLGKALAGKLGLTVKFDDRAWVGIFAGVATNKYDCIISAVTITEERKQVYNFTQPYIGNAQSIVLLKNSPNKIQKPEDLGGLRVSYQEETASGVYVAKLIGSGIKITVFEYDNVMNCFDELKLGRVDAIICDSLVALDYVGAPDSVFTTAWQGVSDEQFGVCLKKGNDKLTAALNTALDELFQDGTMKKLSEDIFHMDMVSEVKS
jgi:polar amino acid transport system substrate-binding protein